MQTAFHRAEVQVPEEPSWLHFAYVVGYDEGGEGEGGEGTEGEEGTEGGEEGGEDDESKLPDNIKAILKKERDLRAAAEKKAKILEKNAAAAKTGGKGTGTKTEGSKAGEGEGGEGQPKVDSATAAKMEKLVEGFRMTSLKSVVAGIASNFQDPNDVYSFLDTTAFDYTQDEDDPTQVVWDEAEIRAAVKDLAKRKPYLLKAAEGGQQGGTKTRPTSGPKFAGAGSGRQTGGITRAEMAQRIPALRTAVRTGDTKKE